MSTEQGISTRCCKCGSSEVTMLWKPHVKNYELPYGKQDIDNEHIRITCNRCGYNWQAKPLDRQPEKAE